MSAWTLFQSACDSTLFYTASTPHPTIFSHTLNQRQHPHHPPALPKCSVSKNVNSLSLSGSDRLSLSRNFMAFQWADCYGTHKGNKRAVPEWPRHGEFSATLSLSLFDIHQSIHEIYHYYCASPPPHTHTYRFALDIHGCIKL